MAWAASTRQISLLLPLEAGSCRSRCGAFGGLWGPVSSPVGLCVFILTLTSVRCLVCTSVSACSLLPLQRAPALLDSGSPGDLVLTRLALPPPYFQIRSDRGPGGQGSGTCILGRPEFRPQPLAGVGEVTLNPSPRVWGCLGLYLHFCLNPCNLQQWQRASRDRASGTWKFLPVTSDAWKFLPVTGQDHDL